MPKQPNISHDPLRAGGRSEPEVAELRRRAEARVRDQRKGQRSKAGDQQSAADSMRTLHELEVHQIELEMQNAELEEARDKLEKLLEKFTDLYDFAPVGYLTLDREGAIREANLTGASLLGITRSALVNRTFGFFVSPADRAVFFAFLKQVFESGAREECEVRLLVEGQPPVDVRMRAIMFESGQACRMALTDITEHKRAEADRLILNKLESTRILAGGIAHDFNNLLTVVLLNLEFAQQLIPAGAELERHLEEAKRAGLLAVGLTTQLVRFAEGGAPMPRATILSEVIQESTRLALSGSNVRCEFSLAEDLWMTEVDAGQIGQVIHGLVLNAREAMPHGGVICARAENGVRSAQDQPSLPAGEYVHVSIADKGTGIAKDLLAKIFDPYFSTKSRGKQKGMGLGLTICHSVVQRHGGAMAVESALGVGTTFHIYLPAVRMLSGKEPAPVSGSVARHRRILVMDDDEAVRKVIGVTLGRMGYDVELAEDGKMAVEIYAKAKSQGRPFDGVILDLVVPGGMGGQEAMQALLRIDPTVKAVLMSGYANDPAVLEPDRYGFKCALAKPFALEKLHEILSRVMGS